MKANQTLGLNEWMKYRFQVFASGWIRKDDFAQLASVSGAEALKDGGVGFSAFAVELACDEIGIDHRNSRSGEKSRNRRLSRGNAPGQSKNACASDGVDFLFHSAIHSD